VDVGALRAYSDSVGQYENQAETFGDMVGQADVGDESWGVVGILTKSQYTEALGELQELLRAMRDGLQASAAKVAATADQYDAIEDHVEAKLREIMSGLAGEG
jgi:hypothetical protein